MEIQAKMILLNNWALSRSPNVFIWVRELQVHTRGLEFIFYYLGTEFLLIFASTAHNAKGKVERIYFIKEIAQVVWLVASWF